MDISLTEIKDLVAIAKPVIDPIIHALIQPKIQKLSKWLKGWGLDNVVEDHFFENKFTEYLARTYHDCQNINTLIFKNQQIKLKEIYYPLTIESDKDHQTIYIDDFKKEYITKYEKILISDTAGMGKSTLSKFITMKAIENKIAIPIHIELRNLREDHKVVDEILNQINPIDNSFDKDIIFKFLELGEFLIVFDGFDEIQTKNQEIIIKDLRTFINKVSANQFILTSRPEGALAAFGDFQSFNILSLHEEQSYELILKYDSICPVKIGERLISDIKKGGKETKELLGNPFLVSLIYLTYTYNKDIPSSKATFYEEIYTALFKGHDLSKDGWTRPKKTNLDIHQFRVILRQLAFDTSKLGAISYSESEIIQHIKNANSRCPGIEINPVDFIEDLLSSVPLFQRDGIKVKWAHKSLQDYFSADYIAFNSRKEEILQRIYDSKKESFMNILDLFCDLDFKTFRNIIVLNLLKDFVAYFDNSYQNFPDINPEWVERRKVKSYAAELFIFDKEAEKLPIEKLLGYLSENVPQIGERHNMLIGLNGCLSIQNYSFSRLLIDLFATKKFPFIVKLGRVRESKNFSLRAKKFKSLKIDDSASFFNEPKYFDKITSLYSFEHHLDYRLSKEEVKNINAQILNENQFNSFADI